MLGRQAETRSFEALIRGCLGELPYLDEVDPDVFSYPELGAVTSMASA